ncbi:MAG: carboxypeptidase-like regulatory domain-containing protein [Cetobacterium sp.]|uniref:carboxypeptidase-like regulatory domain-containing protein n=1 Tax=Cetobacterium sp. TaxID=2071632 RepID=UPI003F31369A
MRFKPFLWFIFVFSFNVFAQNDKIQISGFVTDKEFRLGNATVSFFNSSNKVKSIKTNINGSFFIELPKNKYRITVEKNNYTSLIGDNFFVDYIFEEVKPLILSMTNNKIAIYGCAVNKFGEPIKDAEVKIKMKEDLINLTTDSDGNFFFEGQIGLISILIEKEGFYRNGTSLLIQNEKFINDISVVLEAKTFYISGALTQNNIYLQNTSLELMNSKNNKIISTVETSKDGLFEFRDILNYDNVYFRIPKYNYKSKTFTIDKDLRQFNIFMD